MKRTITAISYIEREQAISSCEYGYIQCALMGIGGYGTDAASRAPGSGA